MTEKMALKIATILAGFSLLMTAFNVNSTCLMMLYQPELPCGAEKLRKVN